MCIYITYKLVRGFCAKVVKQIGRLEDRFSPLIIIYRFPRLSFRFEARRDGVCVPQGMKRSSLLISQPLLRKLEATVRIVLTVVPS